MQHTPGKWVSEYDHVVSRDENNSVTANDQHSVAICCGPDFRANGRLIAAAPDLLAVCIEAEDWLSNYGGDPSTDPDLADLLKMLMDAIVMTEGDNV